MVPKKRKSKRQTLQAKFRIVKRTKEHHKRVKKGAIVNFKQKPKAENRIPNDWPYKEDLLKEIRNAKDKMEELKLRQKEKRAEAQKNKRQSLQAGKDSMDVDCDDGVNVEDKEPKRPLLSIPSESDATNSHYEDEDEGDFEMKTTNLGQNSRRAYLKELRKVIHSADVILHVLDARDPLGTRSSTIEDMVLSVAGKRLVYVLNKADLVPREVLVSWLSYLRKFHPTLPFKSNTQMQKGNLGSMAGKISKQQESALVSNQAVGAEELIGLLKNYARIGDTKTIISVGCVGFPNVGKSSLINSLLRSRAVGVSSTPGFTKQTQEVILDKTIRLIDSPGIVFADGDSAATTLRNCVHVEGLLDVITPVQAILEKCPQHYLMQLYSIPKYENNDASSFLALVARAMGKLKKGGIANVEAAAKVVLHDWNDGKIKYYVLPPAASALAADGGGSSSTRETVLMSEYSDELDISALGEEDIRVLNQIEACNDKSNVVGSYVPFNENDMQFGDTPTAAGNFSDKKATTLLQVQSNSVNITKLSKKAINAVVASASTVNDALEPATNSTKKRRAVDESRSVAGSAITGVTNAGVLSRKYASDPALEPPVDSRKLQKLVRKKEQKQHRRIIGVKDVSDISDAANAKDESYDFTTDFTY